MDYTAEAADPVERDEPGALGGYGGLVLGTVVALAGALIALAAGWPVLGIPVGAVGLLLMVRAWPEASAKAEEVDPDYELTPPERGARRLRCPCCGYPTLVPHTPDQSCLICEWLVEGPPVEHPEPSQELEMARASFGRYLSVYPPNARPDWSPDPPSQDELDLKRELMDQYAQVLAEPVENAPLWWSIVRTERHALDLERAYSRAVEAEAEARAEAEETLGEEGDAADDGDVADGNDAGDRRG